MYLAGFGAGARRDLLPAAEVIGTVAARAARARGDLPPTEVLGASESISLSDADNVESCAAVRPRCRLRLHRIYNNRSQNIVSGTVIIVHVLCNA